MLKGRPVKSKVRDNIIELLYFLKYAYGYDIHKKYIKIFPRITMRNIYYHLKKGLALKEFAIEKIEIEKGEYSWGGEAEKIYYKLGPNSNPRMDKRIKNSLERKKII